MKPRRKSEERGEVGGSESASPDLGAVRGSVREQELFWSSNPQREASEMIDKTSPYVGGCGGGGGVR